MNGAASEVVVGVVGRPWGTKGQFLVDPRGSDPGLVTQGSVLRLRRPGQDASDHEVLGTHFAGGKLVVTIAGCATPEEAAALRGAEVVVRLSGPRTARSTSRRARGLEVASPTDLHRASR